MASLAVAGVLVTAGSALAADVGDGSLACNVGEICFAQNSSLVGGAKHFYYSQHDHGAFVFSNGSQFKGEASSIKVRDTECGVNVTEEYDFFENVDTFFYTTNSTTINFNGDINDDNGSHKRPCD